MVIETFAVGPLGCNCSIITDEQAREAVVVDPGGAFESIRARLERSQVKVTAIVHTHTHIDHVGATAPLQRWSGASAKIHPEDRFLYDLLPIQSALLGVPEPERCELDEDLRDGAVVRAGGIEVCVIHTPGHTPGSVSFFVGQASGDGTGTAPGPVVFTGDTLFRRGIGRTDLWGGDSATIMRSLKGRLLALEDATMVVAGHGPSTTIGDERRTNPFLRGA